MRKIFRCILAGILSLFVADFLISEVTLHPIPGRSIYLGIKLKEYWQVLFFVGTVFGLMRFFLGPIIAFFNFFLKYFTFGLSSLIFNIFLVWLLDLFFVELTISGILAILGTTLISSLFNKLFKV